MSRFKDMSAGEACSMLFGGFVAFLLSIVWVGFFAGLLLSTLWGWFIVPVFGLPTISIIQAWGIAQVFRCLQGLKLSEEKSKDGFGIALAKAFLGVPLAVAVIMGIAWVAKSWM